MTGRLPVRFRQGPSFHPLCSASVLADVLPAEEACVSDTKCKWMSSDWFACCPNRITLPFDEGKRKKHVLIFQLKHKPIH